MRFLLLPVAILLGASPAAAQLDGPFTLRQTGQGDRVNLNLVYDGNSNYGRNFDRGEFSDVNRSGERITFALRRAPGTFTFEGRGSMERASGAYSFAPSAEFRREMERLGFRDVDTKALFVFALDDLTIAKVTQLQGLLSDRIDTAQLERLINHGAGLRYVQAMTDHGFRKLTSDEYRRARDHGVSAEFAGQMADLGMKLPLAELIRMRDHGVTAEYVRAMRAAGHDVGHDELVRARDHGVTAAFAGQMADLGMKLPLAELIRMRDHGVTADYARAMRAAGHDVGHDELVRARDHGVTADFVQKMGDLGYRSLALSEFVRLRDHGVTSGYVEALRDAGLTKLSAAELVRLRSHGISASYVRRTREMLKEMPTVEQIIRLRTRGDFGR